jgi:hypothetical protein
MFKEISDTEFKKLDCPILFENEPYNRKFGIITNKKNNLGLAWGSDLIIPEIVEIESDIISVGIDQNFAIVNFNNGNILINIDLFYNFLTVKIYHRKIFVITELAIITIDQKSFLKLDEYDLPDMFKEIIFNDSHVVVKCSDGTSINIT